MANPAKALGPLRFLTCGSVDDGKSTLIGRMLYDTHQVLDDQLAALERDSRRHGSAEGTLDLSLLVDGLEAEREQNITIDVAYRSFATAARSFTVADTPGHEQYTRNMATGASTSDLAVILVDARKGVLRQTRRHARICALMGIKSAVLAVNKIDLVGFDRHVFDGIRANFEAFAADLGFSAIRSIPVSALRGDNVLRRSAHLDWYSGPTLIEHLESVDPSIDLTAKPFRMAVQLVRRPGGSIRGFAGRIASGTIANGQEIAVAVSGATTRVQSIMGPDGDVERADAGDTVTLTLADEIDIARGDVLATPQSSPAVADQFTSHLVWMAAEPLSLGRRYAMRLGTRWVPAAVTQLKHRLDVDTGERETAQQLSLNEIGAATLATDLPVAFDPYADNRSTGAFILVDRDSNAIAAAGMIDRPRRRPVGIRSDNASIDKTARARLKGHRALCVWLTGPASDGKSALADALEQRLHRLGMHVAVIDGDTALAGIGADTIRRAGEAARLLTEAGLIVICGIGTASDIERGLVRAALPAGEFIEALVTAPAPGVHPEIGDITTQIVRMVSLAEGPLAELIQGQSAGA